MFFTLDKYLSNKGSVNIDLIIINVKQHLVSLAEHFDKYLSNKGSVNIDLIIINVKQHLVSLAEHFDKYFSKNIVIILKVLTGSEISLMLK